VYNATCNHFLGRERALSKFFVDDELHEREIKLRGGEKASVYLQEMSEQFMRFRANLILDTNAGDGESNVRLDRQRSADFRYSIKDWDFEDEDGNKLPIEDASFRKLKGYISDQISNHIRKLNELPDDIEEVKNQFGEVTQEAEENPTFES
jgi:hypothetical protein